MSKPANPPAFPHIEPRDPQFSSSQPGMTLRDWFAGQALGAAASHAFANIDHSIKIGLLPEEWAGKIAIRLADELLAERERGQ